MYMLANESAPEGAEKKRFFEELNQVALDFNNNDKIVSIDSLPEALEDIKGDM